MEKKVFVGTPFLIDVAVRIKIWTRSQSQKEQFDIIKKVKPSILFIESDGGRNERERSVILSSRNMILEGIDWNCDAYLLFFDSNIGMYALGEVSKSVVWKHTNKCIFLEDDYIPTESMFYFCKEMLDKYENDLRVQGICCVNIEGVNKRCTSDYFFARQGMLWAYAKWKRSAGFCEDCSYIEDSYTMKLLKEKKKNEIPNDFWKRIIKNGKQKKVNRPFSSNEFWSQFRAYSQNQLLIIPSKNQISCYGDIDGEHSSSLHNMPKYKRRLFRMEKYELTFPLKHPLCMIPDDKYSKLFVKNVIASRRLRLFFRRAFNIVRKLFFFRKKCRIN